MEKFLYLTELAWANTWIDGGDIPIQLASTYLSDKRNGTRTPDENLIHESEVPFPSLRQYGFNLNNAHGITIVGCTFDGVKIPDVVMGNHYKEDGLILSFCNRFDVEIARRLQKNACVRIIDIEKMKAEIDQQLNKNGYMGLCKYTKDHQRNHFLKSQEDSWQEEFRIFWKSDSNKIVKIPKGTAELVWTI